MKIKKILLTFDQHLRVGIKQKPWELVKKFAKWFKPDTTIVGGDFLHLELLSRFLKDKKKPLENKRLEEEFELGRKELKKIISFTKDEVVFIEGNHEEQIERAIEVNPVTTEGFIELEKNLRFQEQGVKYVRYNEIYSIGKLNVIHGWYCSKSACERTLTEMGASVAFGHKHGQGFITRRTKKNRLMGSYNVGCLCNKNEPYLKKAPSQWMNGFGVLYVQPNGRFNLYLVPIIDSAFVWNGKLFKL